MNREAFFNNLRGKVNLTTGNVMGIERVLDYAEKRGTPRSDLAYILATAWWETAQTMQPVKEAYWLGEDWRKKNLRYYPWYGRGLIQTTWQENYKRMGEEIGVDLQAAPDLLLEWDYALPALFIGMEKGLYTGHDLDDYIDNIDESYAEDFREFKEARRIVNGTDKAETIAALAMTFRLALLAGKYRAIKAEAVPVPEPPPPPPPAPVSWWQAIINFFFGKGKWSARTKYGPDR